MIFNVLILSLSLLGAATASPSASEAAGILSARGIDPFGSIPADAVAIPGGGFSFAEDSDTSHWVRVQNSALNKRASSGLSVTLWARSGCGGTGAFFSNVQYGVQSIGQQQYLAIEYRGRALLSNEQLDLSVDISGGADKCAHYVKSLPRSSGPGCFNQPAFSCIRLLKL